MNDELPPNYRNLERALMSPSQVYYDSRAQNWHAKQSNPTFDTAAKKLARATGYKTVRCVCCDEDFPSYVEGAVSG